jgi:rod shape-determining protein MreB and related proteins
VPSGITNVEIRAVRDATKNAGASEVHIIEEPMAAAIGIRMPIMDPVGNMIVDIGGGTTDIAVISLGGVVRSKNLRIAGDKLNNDIISYMRGEFKILIGEKTAEDIKMNIGAILPLEAPLEASIRGRDLITGLPREVIVTDSDVREAISQSIDTLVESVKEVLEITPPEILSDVMHRGIYLAGGGALIKGLAQVIEEYTKITVHIAPDPLTAVCRGTGVVLSSIETYADILIANEDELPPKK